MTTETKKPIAIEILEKQAFDLKSVKRKQVEYHVVFFQGEKSVFEFKSKHLDEIASIVSVAEQTNSFDTVWLGSRYTSKMYLVHQLAERLKFAF